MPGDEALDGVAAEPVPGPAGEGRVGVAAGTFGEPCLHALAGVAGDRDCPVLAALAVAANVGAGAEADLGDGQAGELGHAQPGLAAEGEQRVVAAAVPGAGIGCGEQGRDLVRGQVAQVGPVADLERDAEYPLDEGALADAGQGGVAEQRVDDGQPDVAGGDAVAPARLQVVQERADRAGVQVGQALPGGLLPGLLMDVADQEPDRVAVAGDRVRPGALLERETAGEIGLDKR